MTGSGNLLFDPCKPLLIIEKNPQTSEAAGRLWRFFLVYPSSHNHGSVEINHGSVENGCICIYESFLSLRVVFH